MNGEEKRNEWEAGPYRCIITISGCGVQSQHCIESEFASQWAGKVEIGVAESARALPTRIALMTTTMGSLSHSKHTLPASSLLERRVSPIHFQRGLPLFAALIYIYNQICQHAVITSCTFGNQSVRTLQHYANAVLWTKSFPPIFNLLISRAGL